MKEFAREEAVALESKAQAEEEKLKLMLLPRDPLDEKNIVLEVGTICGPFLRHSEVLFLVVCGSPHACMNCLLV